MGAVVTAAVAAALMAAGAEPSTAADLTGAAPVGAGPMAKAGAHMVVHPEAHRAGWPEEWVVEAVRPELVALPD